MAFPFALAAHCMQRLLRTNQADNIRLSSLTLPCTYQPRCAGGWCHCLFSQNLCLQSGGLGPCQVQGVMAKGSVRTKVATTIKTWSLALPFTYQPRWAGGWCHCLFSQNLCLQSGGLGPCQVQAVMAKGSARTMVAANTQICKSMCRSSYEFQ